MKNYLTILIFSSLFCTSIYALNPTEKINTAACEKMRTTIANTCVKIIIEQPESVEAWIDDRLYIKPDRIHLKKQGIFIEDENSSIALPSFKFDENGPFMLCSKEDAEKEAQDHYNRAIERLIEAFAHSIGVAAGLVSIPPAAICEGYFAVEAWIDAAREYNGYCEARDRDGYSDAQDRDRDRN
ncbi:MAG: hypothetical protein KBD36_06265 [Alphaproteobacteria bacterium]|nr:hypothetical protein [Alphaproteobacteria bacterium]